MKYHVILEETHSYAHTVEAESFEDAKEKAKERGFSFPHEPFGHRLTATVYDGEDMKTFTEKGVA